MDIASLATNLSQARTDQQISVAVAKKSLDAQKQEGDAAIQLLQGAAEVGAEAQAAARSTSGRLDVTA